MKSSVLVSVLSALAFATTVYAADQSSARVGSTGGNTKKAHVIIEKRCTACHSKDKIDSAVAAGKDMVAIQKEMEKKGISLSANERDVLGIFWKQSRPTVKK